MGPAPAAALSLRGETDDTADLSRAILDAAQDAYVATDRWGVVETWSRQASDLFGYTEPEAVGRRLDDLLLPEESRLEHNRRHARVLEPPAAGVPTPERFELWTRDRDGRRLLAEMSMALAHRSGGRPLIAYFARDVTGQREAERLKGEFFALVSHELRTPLTSLIGYLDIVRDEEAGAISQQQRRYLDVIQRNSERLLRLVNDLLFVARSEAGSLSLRRGPVALGSVVHGAVEAIRPRAERRCIRLGAEIEPIAMDGGDADRLGQLVDNLLANALKFTAEGGTVTVRLRRVEADRALMEVADTGVGIAPQDQEHLFERFYRARAAARGAVPGVGLGLSICKAIAEGHGGSISVQSEEGHGATFRIELPLGNGATTRLSEAGRDAPA
jgi:PAS domain S-box-containing protein